MKEMGHAIVSMTEKYADFEISELRHDFPNLLNEQKKVKIWQMGYRNMGCRQGAKIVCAAISINTAN